MTFCYSSLTPCFSLFFPGRGFSLSRLLLRPGDALALPSTRIHSRHRKTPHLAPVNSTDCRQAHSSSTRLRTLNILMKHLQNLADKYTQRLTPSTLWPTSHSEVIWSLFSSCMPARCATFTSFTEYQIISRKLEKYLAAELNEVRPSLRSLSTLYLSPLFVVLLSGPSGHQMGTEELSDVDVICDLEVWKASVSDCLLWWWALWDRRGLIGPQFVMFAVTW